MEPLGFVVEDGLAFDAGFHRGLGVVDDLEDRHACRQDRVGVGGGLEEPGHDVGAVAALGRSGPLDGDQAALQGRQATGKAGIPAGVGHGSNPSFAFQWVTGVPLHCGGTCDVVVLRVGSKQKLVTVLDLA